MIESQSVEVKRGFATEELMGRPPTKISYGWAHEKPGASPASPSSLPAAQEHRPHNLFANTLSILAIIVSGLSAWYTADAEKRIATETSRSQSRAILYVGDEFGLFSNNKQDGLIIRFNLNNFGQTSAKNLTIRLSTYADRSDDMGHPPGEWPAPAIINVPQVEKSVPMTMPVANLSDESFREIVAGRKTLWVHVGVAYEDEWGQRYDTTKCAALTREQDSLSAQLCTTK